MKRWLVFLLILGCGQPPNPAPPEPRRSPIVMPAPIPTRVTDQNFALLRGDMALDEVVGILGPPTDGLPSTRYPREGFTWNRPDWGHIYLVFEDDRLRRAYQNFTANQPSEKEFPRPTPTPQPTPAPPFQTVVLSGRGPGTTPTVQLRRGLVVVKTTHRGQGEFLASIAAGGVHDEPVAWSRGPSDSTWGYFIGENTPREFIIDMGDAWTLTIDQPTPPQAQPAPREVSGRHFTLLGPYRLTRGVRHFTITSPDRERLLGRLMNREGADLDWLTPAVGHSGYRTALRLEEDDYFIQIESLATWTITIE